MKKLMCVISSALILTGSITLFSACNKAEPVQQINNMNIVTVGQTSYGNLHIETDCKNLALSENPNEAGYLYNVQISLDGGSNWYNQVVAQITSSSLDEDKTASFTVLSYSPEDNSFYLGGSMSFDAEHKTDVAFGDTLNIALRFAAYDNFTVSEPTQTYSYKLKYLSSFGTDFTPVRDDSVEYGWSAVGGISEKYAFEKQNDGEYFLLKEIKQDNGSGGSDDNLLVEISADEAAKFEYKLISVSEHPDYIEKFGSYWCEENSNSNGGWINYDHEQGIAESVYFKYKFTQTDEINSYDQDGVLLETYTNSRRAVALIVRVKAAETSLPSVVKLVHLGLTGWERAD